MNQIDLTTLNPDLFLYEPTGQPGSSARSLLVIFSGVNATRFMGYKLTRDMPCDKLFIRDPSKSWYHGNIDGLAEGIEDLLAKIKVITDKYPMEHVTFLGSSMGGFAALLFGILLNIGKIIAFGPQIRINPHLPNNPKNDSQIEYKDLTPLINSSTAEIDIYIGLNELADIYHVQDIKQSDNVRVQRLFGQPHNVMLFLTKINCLDTIIRSSIAPAVGGRQERRPGLPLSISDSFAKNSTLQNAVFAYYIDKNYSLAGTFFAELTAAYPAINTFWKFYGICLYHESEYKQAQEMLSIAETIAYSDEELHYYQGLISLQGKHYERASARFEQAIQFAPQKKLTYFIKLAISYRESGRLDNALRTLTQSLAISKTNYGTYYQFAQIHKLKNNIDQAITSLQLAAKYSPGNQQILQELHALECNRVYTI
ncbi:hypothetical protein OLMES_0924 [Oleiphilus messinensis]|uniref:Uncharacterized protein n=1 Tax=Oleiphilus messinensis TaxID=141451 RepID=A0A1Y0I3L9_9GAMM|nr:tetratricopeptide repeat protein [Oleiphilus messinensis]ARU55011.1 hypothetical protein OLMES_0924 [Oleiphilus messinensis]